MFNGTIQPIYKPLTLGFCAYVWLDAAFSCWGCRGPRSLVFLSGERGMSLKMPAETELKAGLWAAQSVSKVKMARTGWA